MTAGSTSLYNLGDANAIAANRRGELSPAQRASLRLATAASRRERKGRASGAQESSAGAVRQAEGRVVWGDDEYIAESPAGRLRQLAGDLNLLPGAYRFFYLERGLWLLSAERLDAAKTRTSTEDAARHAKANAKGLLTSEEAEELARVLAEANGFDLGAVAACRAGRLHRSGLRRLRNSAVPHLVWSQASFVAAAASASHMARSFSVGEYYSNLSVPAFAKAEEHYIVAIWMAILFLLFTAAGFYFLARLRRVARDMRERRVVVTEGMGWKAGSGVERGNFFYEVNDQKFKVSWRAYNALIDGLPYRLYFAPHSRLMLCVEPADRL